MKTSFTLIAGLAFFIAKAQVFNITNFGAVGNGSTLNTQAIQAAVDSCNSAGGGIVLVPPGNFLTATVFIKSNVIIQIDSGATITGSSTVSDYPDVISLIRSYTDNYPQRSVFYAEGQHNIGIIGKGTFNGNGQSISFLIDASHKPYGFRFVSCTNVRYEGVKLLNSGFWMMHNFDIDTLVIKNVRIINQNLGNGDGISIDGCRHVMVDSCFADCNDDALVLKTTSPIPCEHVSVSNCTLASYSRCIKLGTETHGAYRDIHISNINVGISTLGPLGNNPAKCGINLSAVDGGSLEDVLIENVTMTGIKVPLLIRLGNRAHKYTPTAPVPGVGFIHNIELRNITATATTNVTSSITGIPGYYAKDIMLSDVDVTFPGGQAAVYPGFVVPENETGGPEATIFGDTLPASGLYVRHVDSLQLHNVCFHAFQPDGRPTFVFDDVLNSGDMLTVDSLQNCFSTGVNDLIGEERIGVYPNPSNGNFELQIEERWINHHIKVALFDVAGRKVFECPMFSPLDRLDVSNLPNGIYFIRLFNGQSFLCKRIIKE
jgi:hypothetical protein